MSVMITADGARVIKAMIVSCGNAACKEAIRRLDEITGPQPLEVIGTRGDNSWLMPVFERLKWYAEDYHVTKLDAEEVIRYFGGNLHIEIFKRAAHKTAFGREFGSAVGLVSHVLLPLTNGRYENAGHTISFSQTVQYNPEEGGAEFYHLGLVIHLQVPESLVEEVLAEQRKNKDFLAAISMVSKPIGLPENYGDALACNAATLM